eukprot:291469_1
MSTESYNIHPTKFDQYILSDIEIFDVRYPTSDFSHGSDAVHVDPDYSAAYILLKFTHKYDKSQIVGHGMTFTLGKGTEIICACIQSMFPFIRGMSFGDITSNPLAFSNKLSNHPQFRWIGPEKGFYTWRVLHSTMPFTIYGVGVITNRYGVSWWIWMSMN